MVGPGEVLPAENAARGRDLSEQAVHSAAAHPLRDPLFGRTFCMVEQTVCLKLVYLSTIIWLIRMAEDVGLWGYFKVDIFTQIIKVKTYCMFSRILGAKFQ